MVVVQEGSHGGFFFFFNQMARNLHCTHTSMVVTTLKEF
jgi:hypothetical protein